MNERRHFMKPIVSLLFAVAMISGIVAARAKTSTPTAKEIRGATPYIEIKNEPPPKLIVDPPLPEGMAHPVGIFWAQYRVENVRIAPMFGAGALQVSPRVGHLHITVDDLPWWWADASENNTIDIAGLPPGQHKVKIELVDANHKVFPGQSKTVTFTIPKK
jgi:Family of unknown function (DUF6130)